MNDMDLGHRFVTGGETELEEIIDMYGEKLLRYATTILCDYHDAENVIQEVFLSAYQNRTTFDGSNLSAWLYKITYNRSLNQLKKHKLFCFSEIRNEMVASTEDTGLSEGTLYALGKLRPKERALLYARIMEEQSYNELSHSTGCSPSALRKQFERAKKKMAKYLTTKSNRKESTHE